MSAEPKVGTNRGNAGKGRPAGSQNKSTVSVKAAFEQAFDEMGGAAALVQWGREQPTEFYKLYAKLLPVQVNADMKHQGTVSIVVDTGVPRAPDEPAGDDE